MKETIIIDGWWGSGKSTLRGLFDGHSSLMVCPIQDSLCGGFSNQKSLNDILEYRDLGEFRKMLWGMTDYSRVEKYALDGNIFNYAEKGEADYGVFDFDFYKFDQELVERFKMLEVWTVDKFLSLYYDLFKETWKGQKNKDAQISVSMDNNYEACTGFISEKTNYTKYIWVDRPSEDILAVFCNRKPMEGHVGTKGWGQTSLNSLVRSGYVFRHERRRKLVKHYAKMNPDTFMITSLKSLVEDTQDEMKKLAAFANIPYEPVLAQYTYMGSEFPGSARYIGKLNDTGENSFTPQELKKIRQEVVSSQKGFGSLKVQLKALRHVVGTAQRTYKNYCGSFGNHK
jgi:hypothetical protein